MRIDHRWLPPLLIGMIFLSLVAPASLPLDEGLARISIPWEILPSASGEPDDRGWTLPAGDYQVESIDPARPNPAMGVRSAGDLYRTQIRRSLEPPRFTLRVRTRGVRPRLHGFEAEVPLGLRRLRRRPGAGLPSRLIPGWHQERFDQENGPTRWLYLPPASAYAREGDGFWLRTDRGGVIKMMSRRRVGWMELRVHSLVQTELDCPDCPGRPELPLAPHREERLLVLPRPCEGGDGSRRVTEIRLSCRGGARPSELDPASRDRRDLGVYCRLPRQRDHLWLADRLLAAGLVEEARRELSTRHDPLFRSALTRILPTVPATDPISPPPPRAGELPELAALWSQPGDRSLRIPPEESASDSGKVSHRFGSLELLATRVIPPRVRPGDSTTLEFRLRIGQPGRTDPLLLVHALPDGPTWLKHPWWRLRSRLGWGRPGLLVGDHRPAPGVGPPWTWLPGETVMDRTELAIPEGVGSGAYRILLSVVDRIDGSVIREQETGRRWITAARFQVE